MQMQMYVRNFSGRRNGPGVFNALLLSVTRTVLNGSPACATYGLFMGVPSPTVCDLLTGWPPTTRLSESILPRGGY